MNNEISKEDLSIICKSLNYYLYHSDIIANETDYSDKVDDLLFKLRKMEKEIE